MDVQIVPPPTIAAFRERLMADSAALPRRLRQCAEYVAGHQDRIAVSTVADIAQGAGVPPSAVMRFCQIMGFAGYSDLQKLYRDVASPGFPDYATRLRNLKENPSDKPAAILAEFVEAGRKSLEILAQSIDPEALEGAVAALAQARTLHIIGRKRSFPIAAYFAYIFEKLGVPAMLHDGVGQLDPSPAIQPGDAVIVITFAPYAADSLALALAAADRGVAVVLLTDRLTCPVARLAKAVLTISEVDFGAFRAPTATLAVAVSVAVAVAAARK